MTIKNRYTVATGSVAAAASFILGIFLVLHPGVESGLSDRIEQGGVGAIICWAAWHFTIRPGITLYDDRIVVRDFFIDRTIPLREVVGVSIKWGLVIHFKDGGQLKPKAFSGSLLGVLFNFPTARAVKSEIDARIKNNVDGAVGRSRRLRLSFGLFVTLMAAYAAIAVFVS